jgi:hypothetical protein
MRAILALIICAGVAPLTFGDPPTNASAPVSAADSATEAPASAASAEPAQSNAAAPAGPTSQSKSAASPSTSALSADDHSLMSRGYKPQMKNGQKLWCREYVSTGTRLVRNQEECTTADVIKQRTDNARAMTDRAQSNMLDTLRPGG